MPETPINEYSDFLVWKRKIGFAKDWIMPAPAYDFRFTKNDD